MLTTTQTSRDGDRRGIDRCAGCVAGREPEPEPGRPVPAPRPDRRPRSSATAPRVGDAAPIAAGRRRPGDRSAGSRSATSRRLAVGGLLALDGGYLGWEAAGDAGYPVARYSSDGLAWTHADLAKEVTPCPGWSARPDGEVSAGATNGQSVVLVGLEYAPASRDVRHVASRCLGDHRRQRRGSGRQGSPHPATGNAWAQDVWATPTGWEAGSHQAPAPSRSGNPQMGSPGRRRRSVAKGRCPEIGAHASARQTGPASSIIYDDATETSHAADVQGRPGLAPDRWSAPDTRRDRTHPGTRTSLPAWIVVTTEDDAEKSTIWTSTDLGHWDSAPFPMPAVESIAHTAYGLLAFG